MEMKDWIMVVAVIAGPILAVQAQKRIERIREKRGRKLRIFHTLMSTRATRLSPEHVSALNMIDLEFYGVKILGHRWQSKSEKKVTNAWKTYNDLLNDKAFVENRFEAWSEKRDELFTAVLYAMSQALGYDFDEVQLKRDCYRPVAHGDIENEQHKIRKAMVDVFEGTRPLPIAVTYLPPYRPIDPVKPEELSQTEAGHNQDTRPDQLASASR
jgi:hypothetical protein